jgi:hypothetical protein
MKKYFFPIFILIVFAALLLSPKILAAALTGGAVTMSDSRPSATTVSYTINWTGVTATTIRCIKTIFSDAATAGSMPTGFTSTGTVALDAASTFVVSPASWTLDKTTNGTLKLTYATGQNGTSGTLVFTGITNGSLTTATYYVQFNTYSDTGCATGVDSGTATFKYTNGQAVSVTVDPSMTFALAGVASSQSVNGATTTVTTVTDANTIPLGTVTSSANAIAAQDVTMTTNAASGYTVYIRYTGVPTSGSNTIDDFTGTNASPTTFSSAGTEAFGYTTNETHLSGSAARFSSNKWAKFTTSNLEVAHSAAAVSSETVRVGYQVGIAGTTEAGGYTTTVVLTAVPTY